MAEILLDTDVLVDHLRSGSGISADGNGLHYSVISRAELFAGRGTEEGVVGRVLAPLYEHGVDRLIAEGGGRVRRTTGLSLPDALIAATAMLHGLVLVTRNRRHFDRVEGLDIRSPV